MHIKSIIISSVAFLALSNLALANTPTKVLAAKYQSLMNPPTANYTWLGGDAAASVKLTSNKYLWLFGDTLVGESDNQGLHQLRRYSFISNDKSKYYFHSSVGITRNTQGSWSPIVKYFKENSTGYPTGIINSDTKSSILWTVNGIMLKHKLLLITVEVPTKGFTFGTTFALVNNPSSSPKNWHYQLYRILPENSSEQLFSGVLRKGPWIYFYGLRGEDVSSPKSKQILARIHIKDAEHAHWRAIRYWQKGKPWTSKPKLASSIEGLPPQTEESIDYRPDLGWITMQIPGDAFKVHLFHAKTLTGPWHDTGTVFHLPKIWLKKIHGTNKPLFDSYAVKIHPELSNGNNIVFTYNTNMSYSYTGNNLKKIQQLIVSPIYGGLYIPQLVVCTNKSHPPYVAECSGY